ncbi:MAG TPA: hypothetical protein VFZ59_13565 [Verrucomicrobiae bacterium]|nr:hypothetical protein [Verrucomicrobiae bacterium]
MSRPFCWAAVALIGLITTAVTHAATTNAVIPYKAMDDLWQIASSADQSKLMVRVFVASTNKTVRPADIVLTIQSASAGKIPVQLSTNGQIIDFPHRTELVRENPSIVANQPRGTLNLFIGYKIPVEGLSFPYSRLGHAAAEANKMIKSQAGMTAMLAAKAQGVVFVFPRKSSEPAKVTILAVAGRREFIADKDGRVKLKLEESLLSENPEVQLSEKPDVVLPDMD